ncbi:hypothetical protein RRG08_031045 [Elysia crispata]|uniref:Uncharacterized protein n=1 Tax=Elysia crispata TaxID=231223 RepID=A0AAE0ZGB9_9GAST|nr:hypothetical protein RRG08_031045 [Elysia crispata]
MISESPTSPNRHPANALPRRAAPTWHGARGKAQPVVISARVKWPGIEESSIKFPASNTSHHEMQVSSSSFPCGRNSQTSRQQLLMIGNIPRTSPQSLRLVFVHNEDSGCNQPHESKQADGRVMFDNADRGCDHRLTSNQVAPPLAVSSPREDRHIVSILCGSPEEVTASYPLFSLHATGSIACLFKLGVRLCSSIVV